MIRRILIEMEAEGSEALLPEIMRLVMQHVDMNERFKIDQSIMPDILPGKKFRDKDTGICAARNDTTRRGCAGKSAF